MHVPYTTQGRTKEEVARWAELIRAIPQGKCTPVEIPTTTPDGKPCIILNTVRATRMHSIGRTYKHCKGIHCSSPGNPRSFRFFHSLEDVTEQRRTETLLQEERAKLRKTVDELQVLKLLFDRSPLG